MFRIFRSIYLPMAGPALAAIFILQATFVWNDLLLGLTLSQSESVRPIMPALTGLQSTYGGAALPTVLAGGLLVSLPTVDPVPGRTTLLLPGPRPRSVLKGLLSSRTVVVTGGAAGIGRGAVERFVAEGDSVVALDRDADALAALRRRVGCSRDRRRRR